MSQTPKTRIAYWIIVALIAIGGLAIRGVGILHPFWMDESFSSVLATQNLATIVSVCKEDVHPPAYYLALRAWNGFCRFVLRSPAPEEDWTLVGFEVEFIETAGRFEWIAPNGSVVRDTGIFPLDWHRHPLAPLWALRLLGVAFAAGTTLLAWRAGRRLAAGFPSVPLIALALFCFSGYAATWDTVIRSYSAGGLLTAGLAAAALWGAESGKWRWAGPICAALLYLAFMTNYVTILFFPGIALAAWVWAGWNRRTLFHLAGWLCGGVVLSGLTWGKAFFEQTSAVPSGGFQTETLFPALSAEFGEVILYYWSMVFSEGLWVWLRAGIGTEYFNPLHALSPINPWLYAGAFILAGASVGANIWDCFKRPSKTILCLSLIAFLPCVFIVVGNALRPGMFRIHGRHLYPAAPFLYLFLARGWALIGGWIAGQISSRSGAAR